MSAASAVDTARARTTGAGDGASWFVHDRWDEAHAEGVLLDRSSEAPGRLHGVPVAVKANCSVAGVRPTAGSAALDDVPVAEVDAGAVALVRAAGAIIVGTVNLDELAYGFTGRNPHHGSVPNPHAADRLSGGSSSGSAATVAAGVVPVALGTDTNGSVRVPAALCGVWGLRPTMGCVPLDGVVPLARSLDTPGPLAASSTLLTDAAAALGIDVTPRVDPARVRVRTVSGFPAEPATPPVRAGVATVAAALRNSGDVVLPWCEAARAGAQLVTAVEGAAAFADVLRNRPERIGPLVRHRLRAGALIDGVSYVRALRLRAELMAVAEALFGDVDLLVLPTVPTTAPADDAETVGVDGMVEHVNAALGRCTTPFSFLGLPALSVPVAERGDDGLPVGVQLVARWGDDALLLAVAQALEHDGVAAAHLRP